MKERVILGAAWFIILSYFIGEPEIKKPLKNQ